MSIALFYFHDPRIKSNWTRWHFQWLAERSQVIMPAENENNWIKKTTTKIDGANVSWRWGHHCVELFIVDLSVSVDVCFVDHGRDLLARQLFAEVHHHDGQLLTIDEAVAILGKDNIRKRKNKTQKIFRALCWNWDFGLSNLRHFVTCVCDFERCPLTPTNLSSYLFKRSSKWLSVSTVLKFVVHDTSQASFTYSAPLWGLLHNISTTWHLGGKSLG